MKVGRRARRKLVFDQEHSKGSVYVLGFEKEEVRWLIEHLTKAIEMKSNLGFNRKFRENFVSICWKFASTTTEVRDKEQREADLFCWEMGAAVVCECSADSVKWVEEALFLQDLRFIKIEGGNSIQLRRWSPKENSLLPALIEVIDGDWVFTISVAVIEMKRLGKGAIGESTWVVLESHSGTGGGRLRDLDQRLEVVFVLGKLAERRREKKGGRLMFFQWGHVIRVVRLWGIAGPLRLGQGEGEKKTSEKQVTPRREEVVVGVKGKGERERGKGKGEGVSDDQMSRREDPRKRK
ncbi:hypothetical protein CK203_056571 [Vitis vinifera]|uniref:DUF4283 domain-containing protein n=1 Tax=Vitis vinifera TaxID=29760 RepID=A0A438GKA7_VITVI|nr:hypothetical protein CK203_056571 [Vitis vinifera]